MLVLTRRENEDVHIYKPDGSLLGTVRLVSVETGQRARIAFMFPREYEITRQEADTKKRETRR